MAAITIGTLAALLGVLVTIELCQLGVVASTWIRSRRNDRRTRVLLKSLGFDPDDLPTYEIQEELRRDREDRAD